MEKTPDTLTLLQSIQDRNWPVVISAGFTLIVWIFRNLIRDRMPTQHLPYITLSIAVFTAIAMRTSQQAESGNIWWHGTVQGLVEGITVGLCSMGVWSVGAKRVLPIIKDR